MAEYNNFNSTLILCVCVHFSLTESRTSDHAEVGACEHSQATLLLLLWRGEDAVNVAIVFHHTYFQCDIPLNVTPCTKV